MVPLEHGHAGEALVQDVGGVLRSRQEVSGRTRPGALESGSVGWAHLSGDQMVEGVGVAKVAALQESLSAATLGAAVDAEQSDARTFAHLKTNS